MDYFEMKMAQRFAPEGAARSAQDEAETFYQSFGTGTAWFTGMLERLAIKRPKVQTEASRPLQPVLREATG